jgi:hypothetical protein
MLKSKIIDGFGNSNLLKVNEEGTIGVVIHQHPPLGETLHALPYQSFFKNEAGSSDMRVAGSLSSPLLFKIEASPKFDTYVKTISIEIADASATLSKFGNIAALANGITIDWFTSSNGLIPVSSDLKTNWDFIRLAGGQPAFGSGTSAFRASNVSGSSEGYIPFIDVAGVFGLIYGLQLRKGTNDSIVFSIKDDISTVDSFNAIAYGLTL